jgi:O-antigen ligase
VHNVPAANVTATGARLDRVISTLTGVAVVVALVAPRIAVATMVLLLPVFAAPLRSLDTRRVVWALPGVVVALLVFGLWIALNAAWSVDRVEAYGKVLFYFVALAVGWTSVSGLEALDRERLERLSRAVVTAVMLGAAYLAIEVWLDQPIQRALMNMLPFIKPSAKHAVVADGRVVAINDYMLNRNVAVLVLMLWPAWLLMRSLSAAPRARLVVVGLLALSAAAVFGSEHETSMLALIFSAATFGGLVVAPAVMRRLVVAGWITATLLVVPIAAWSYSAGLHQASWIPTTGRNRIILWAHTAAEIRKAPLLGTGVASTKALDERSAATAAQPADHSYPLRTGRHSHNIYLQAWYELGAIGAVVLLAIGLTALAAMSRLPQRLQPYAYASFVSAAMIGAFSWGLWQTWFMAAYAVWAMLLMLALTVAARHRAAIDGPSDVAVAGPSWR